jgi:hypothetical protein
MKERQRDRENGNAKLRTCNKKQTAQKHKYRTTTEMKENTIAEVQGME